MVSEIPDASKDLYLLPACACAAINDRVPAETAVLTFDASKEETITIKYRLSLSSL